MESSEDSDFEGSDEAVTRPEDGLEGEFQRAAQRVQALAADLPGDKLLHLYARYKQATVGKCDTLRPGMFDFQGKQKWDAWHGLSSMSKEQAMAEYVAAVKVVDPDWSAEGPGKGGGARRSGSGMGVVVSTMCKTEDDISDLNKTIFDWCKEGDAGQTEALLREGGAGIDETDDEGMGLLHWAADRGHAGVIQVLLDHRANVNVRDEEGQTPLHYAAACEHPEIVSLLLAHGADCSLVDNEGLTAAETTSEVGIRAMLAQHAD